MKIDFVCSEDINDQLTNINVAKSLIEHGTSYFSKIFNQEEVITTFKVEDLEEIANYILVYCKAERIRQGYTYTEEQK